MYMTLKSVDMFASSVFTGNWVFKFSGEVLEEIIILFRFETVMEIVVWNG